MPDGCGDPAVIRSCCRHPACRCHLPSLTTAPPGIPKLEDANDAGGRSSEHCTLILTEGDSAKSLAVAGLSVVGRDRFGVFPLRWATWEAGLGACMVHPAARCLFLQASTFRHETGRQSLCLPASHPSLAGASC